MSGVRSLPRIAASAVHAGVSNLAAGFDSTEPFGPEPFGRELRVERLTADGLVAGSLLASDKGLATRNLTPEH